VNQHSPLDFGLSGGPGIFLWQSLWLFAFQLYLNAAQLKIPFALSLSKDSGCRPVIRPAHHERLSEEHCVLPVSTTPTQQGDILWEPAILILARVI
jgi:hypothetical protein